jgi:hypothetical protein
MKLVLTPYWIAEECFLQEALIWAAFYRYPKSEIIPDRVDMRFDRDVQEEYEPRTPNLHEYIESDEATRVGLPPNPEWEAIINDEESAMFSDPATIKMLLEANLEEEHKDRLRQDLIRSEEQAKIQAEWDEKYEAYIELIESKLFVALREGKIKAFGRKLPHNDLETAMGILNKKRKTGPGLIWNMRIFLPTFGALTVLTGVNRVLKMEKIIISTFTSIQMN